MHGCWWEPFVVEDARLCSLCGGLCCQAHPGLYLDPLQFAQAWNLEGEWEMREVLYAHSLTLRLCMGIPLPLPLSAERGCVFWGEKGCLLPRWQRPLECLVLVPSEESLFNGEPSCSIPPQVSYVECFYRWGQYYHQRGIWSEVKRLAEGHAT